MTTTIASLPLEVLLGIFREIGSAAQLGRCRLVCRQWNSPAEKAMLGSKIVLDSTYKAIWLYGHLCTDITKGRCIKHMHFEIVDKHLPPIYPHLLRLAFTPSIQSLTGTVRPKSFYNILMEIADNTLAKFNCLSELPHDDDDDNNMTMIKAAIKFDIKRLSITIGTRHTRLNSHEINAYDFIRTRNTVLYAHEYNALGSFTIGTRNTGLNSHVINALGSFTSLESLRIVGGDIQSWQNLDQALNRCTSLKKLALEDITIGISSIASKTEVQSWVTANAQKVPSLRELEFDNVPFRPDLLECLMYKYPNVASIKAISHLSSHSSHFSQYNPLLGRSLEATDNIKTKELSFIILDSVSVHNEVANARGPKRSTSLCIERYKGKEEIVMKIR